MATKEPELKELWPILFQAQLLFQPIVGRSGLGRAAGASALLTETITSPVYASEITPDMSGGSRGAGGTVAYGGVAYSCAILPRVICFMLAANIWTSPKKLGYESPWLRRYKFSAIFL